MTPLTITAPLSGYLTRLDEVDDPVFSQRLLGDGMAIDPLSDTLLAPCAGTIVAIHHARHAVTIVADCGAEFILHIGLDTVALAGDGFTPLVVAEQRVAAGTPLVRFDLGAIARRVPSLATPIILTAGDRFRIGWSAEPGMIAAGTHFMTIVPLTQAVGQPADGKKATVDADAVTIRRQVTVPLAHGLHARPAARLAAAARPFAAEIRVAAHGREARIASPTALLALAVRHGDVVELIGSGAQANDAVAAIATLIESGMGEGATVATAAVTPSMLPAPAVAFTARVPSPVPELANVLAGVTAAPGLAIGPAFRWRVVELAAPERGEDPATERLRLKASRDGLRAELDGRAQDGTAGGAIAAAHAAFLDDPELIDAADAFIADGASASHAWRTALHAQADLLAQSHDARVAERAADLRDLAEQLVALMLGGAAGGAGPVAPPGAIVLADDLLPSHVGTLDPATVAGIVTARGGPTSHVAIIAAGLGLPMLVAVGPALAAVAEGATLILDADAGRLEVAPPPARLTQAEGQVRAARGLAAAQAMDTAPGRTADGHAVQIMANLGGPADAEAAMAAHAEGCGLLRTELLFLDRTDPPGEDEQASAYRAIADRLEGRPLVIRLLDIGGDKPAPYLPIPHEENPALGLRGIRVTLAYPDVLRTQVRAILRSGRPGQCRIMVPMVASVAEIHAVRAVVDEARIALGIRHPVEIGTMVETPAAAIMADVLAKHCDFLSIGTNDLTQYTLAMDRGNAAVAAGVDGLHPAVLRLIARTCDGARVRNRWAGVCGGLASDLAAVPILVGLGVTKLSATPAGVPRVRALVGRISLTQAQEVAARALDCADAASVRMLTRTFLAELDR